MGYGLIDDAWAKEVNRQPGDHYGFFFHYYAQPPTFPCQGVTQGGTVSCKNLYAPCTDFSSNQCVTIGANQCGYLGGTTTGC